MPTVELIYDPTCPNVQHARVNLGEALRALGLREKWMEYRSEDAPPHARGYGSPAVLVDGRDVAAHEPGAKECCRLYRDGEGRLSGVPSADQIAAALAKAARAEPTPPKNASAWRRMLAALPGAGAALLPKVVCPACWPAYAAFLSSIGLGFLMQSVWLLPLTAVFLLIAVGALAFRASARRGYGPAVLGVVASVLVLLGKFALESEALTYAAIGLLMAASVWNVWPRRARSCAACATSN